jgi:Na+(H+)/acetate symporter ActP
LDSSKLGRRKGYRAHARRWFGISPEGIGTIGMLVNLIVVTTVARFTPPLEVQHLVDTSPREPARRTKTTRSGDFRAEAVSGYEKRRSL